MDLGNTSPDTPEGLLALVCFWTFGNLMPGSDQLAKTPAGLAANGFMSLLNMCSLQKGRLRKPKEIIECYFEIGRDIALGNNNWAEEIAHEDAPHERVDFDKVRDLLKQKNLHIKNSSEGASKATDRFTRLKPK